MPSLRGLFCEKNMTILTQNLGAAPSGAGGDTSRSGAVKFNENFTNNTHAASRLVGGSGGNVMGVGQFGIGYSEVYDLRNEDISNPENVLGKGLRFGIINGSKVGGSSVFCSAILMSAWSDKTASGAQPFILFSDDGHLKAMYAYSDVSGWATSAITYHSTRNTTVDGNGFIKNASPVVQLFADKIELNDEAAEQDIAFEKIDIGHYLVKGSSGFSNDGWWIEVPTDSNGNKICAVEYQTLENGDLEIKTFKKKLNDEGDIVANLEAPIDIPSNSNDESRWIDIRLNEIKKAVVIKTPRTEKKAKMVQQIKYAPQLVYFMVAEDMLDDDGKLVVVKGETQKINKPHIQTDASGTPILTSQPVVNERGETVLEWVQAVDSVGQAVFEDVPVLDAKGNQIIDEVVHEPQ